MSAAHAASSGGGGAAGTSADNGGERAGEAAAEEALGTGDVKPGLAARPTAGLAARPTAGLAALRVPRGVPTGEGACGRQLRPNLTS